MKDLSMFGDGTTPCPVCGRKWGHLSTCGVPEMHEKLEAELKRYLRTGHPLEMLDMRVFIR